MTRLRLSPHFVIEEFDCHDGRRVPDMALTGLRLLVVERLELMRAHFGPCTVVSGYRHEAYNRAIGGARNSWHIYDFHGGRECAADVHFRQGSVAQWRDFAERLARRASPAHGGVGYYPAGGFVHVDNRSYLAEWVGS